MYFAALVALTVVASIISGLATHTPSSSRLVCSKRDSGPDIIYITEVDALRRTSSDVNTVVEHNGTVPFHVGTDILQRIDDTVPEVEQLSGGLGDLVVNGTGANLIDIIYNTVAHNA
ncbi:hypothetical protein DFH29DRAFT_994549 [Suillus ampliporus]|nr:hypothetical protein DFH29DRAFT_994549 [Suillus ampliporus]